MEISRNLNWHKRQAKIRFKQYLLDKAEGTCIGSMTQWLHRNVRASFDSDFKFTLMNAQHTYAKMIGFASWKELKDYCEGGIQCADADIEADA